MKYSNNKVQDLKIAYIGGGSCGWAWGLMSDWASAEDISGQVALYDIDFEAAKANEVIGNRYNDLPDCRSKWSYKAEQEIGDALTGADFVVISILPGTFKEMESDVHTPEKYGIWQPVGDTVGPGGVIRALRTVPMFETIAKAIRQFCPKAWVINYTNSMTVCMRTLYKVFPEIRAFGCCHEVFDTQKLLAAALEDILGIEKPSYKDVKVNVVGVNHFTWLTDARYGNIPMSIFGQISRILCEQELVVEAALERDLEKAYTAFRNDPLVNLSDTDARALFDEMVENTQAYLTEYAILKKEWA